VIFLIEKVFSGWKIDKFPVKNQQNGGKNEQH
jgi:hypothetical protein